MIEIFYIFCFLRNRLVFQQQFRNLITILQPLLCHFLPDQIFEFPQIPLVSVQLLFRVDESNPRPRRSQDAEESIVVRLGYRIELVIVATGTGNRQTLERFREGVDLIIRKPHLFIQGVGRSKAVKHHAPVNRSENRFVESLLFMEARFFQEIARDMLGKKLVVSDVLIQSSNQVVPIVVGIGYPGISLRAVTFRVANPVHPVPRPPFPKAGTVEEGIDETVDRPVSILPNVLLEPVELFGPGRQADQGKVETTSESPGRCR